MRQWRGVQIDSSETGTTTVDSARRNTLQHRGESNILDGVGSDGSNGGGIDSNGIDSDGPGDHIAQGLTTSFDRIGQIRSWVEKALEPLRQNQDITSALDVRINLYCSGDEYDWLAPVADELRFALLCSDTTVRAHDQAPANATECDDSLSISVEKIDATKCIRCWQRRTTVGLDTDHPEICDRCITNISTAAGETRRFS